MTTDSTQTDILLEQAGIIEPLESFDAVGVQLGKILETITRRVVSQAAYDVIRNRPSSVEQRRSLPQHAGVTGMVAAIGELLDWDIDSVGRFAVALLEDSNMHDESTALTEILKG